MPIHIRITHKAQQVLRFEELRIADQNGPAPRIALYTEDVPYHYEVELSSSAYQIQYFPDVIVYDGQDIILITTLSPCHTVWEARQKAAACDPLSSSVTASRHFPFSFDHRQGAMLRFHAQLKAVCGMLPTSFKQTIFNDTHGIAITRLDQKKKKLFCLRKTEEIAQPQHILTYHKRHPSTTQGKEPQKKPNVSAWLSPSLTLSLQHLRQAALQKRQFWHSSMSKRTNRIEKSTRYPSSKNRVLSKNHPMREDAAKVTASFSPPLSASSLSRQLQALATVYPNIRWKQHTPASWDTLSKPIKDVQRMLGLPVTGMVDDRLLRLIQEMCEELREYEHAVPT